VPHLTVYALEEDLAGREAGLIAGLTEAIVAIYGDWVRDSTAVLLIGLPAARWGIGGKPAEAPPPRVTFGIREAVFIRPDAPAIVSMLITGVTDAMVSVLGERVRPGLTVELVGSPDDRTGVGGVLATH
jgi:phenylpyruvate tautomerase PptA (4-oxalocrotonate tautomerase family)